jgi:hypothetical protein
MNIARGYELPSSKQTKPASLVSSIEPAVPAATVKPMEPLQTKDQLIEKIKEWVKIDNEIRVLQAEQNKRKTEKKRVSVELMEVMKSNDIDAFDINDGQIIYEKRNVKKPITKTTLLAILSTYYKGDIVKAAEINEYILENREEVTQEKIVRKLNKK